MKAYLMSQPAMQKLSRWKKLGVWGGVLLGSTIAIAPATLAKPGSPASVKQEYRESARRRGDIDGYLVYVDRYSRNLLEAVQRVERSATRVRFKGKDVIQLAIYRNRSTAEDRIRDLERRGIIADVATIDTRRYARQFFVYIVSNDPRVLREVRELSPDAFFVRYRGRSVIRVGIFDSEYRALRLVRRLRDHRLIPRVDIVEFEESWARFEPVENERPVANVSEDYYAVVIPCSEDELPIVEAQIRQMAPDLGSQEGISRRNEADGSYVMVGPFRKRETAENWHRYLQDFGMENAQIYYSR